MAKHSFGATINLWANTANKEIDETIRKLRQAGNEIISIQTKIKSGKPDRYIVQYTDGIQKVTSTLKANGEELKATSTQLKKGFDAGRLLWYFNIAKGVWNRFKSIEKEAIDFNETIEKFNVSMGKDAIESATRFQNKIAEAIGSSRAEMMNYQSNFKNIMAGLGDITDQQSERISESLTKMALDYSSLFNLSQQAAANKIQAALVGQIMPIRRDSGYDVSKNAVAAKALELGVERTYSELSETEKRLIRIMLLMEQMKNTGAFEDLARTITDNLVAKVRNHFRKLCEHIQKWCKGSVSFIQEMVY